MAGETSGMVEPRSQQGLWEFGGDWLEEAGSGTSEIKHFSKDTAHFVLVTSLGARTWTTAIKQSQCANLAPVQSKLSRQRPCLTPFMSHHLIILTKGVRKKRGARADHERNDLN